MGLIWTRFYHFPSRFKTMCARLATWLCKKKKKQKEGEEINLVTPANPPPACQALEEKVLTQRVYPVKKF